MKLNNIDEILFHRNIISYLNEVFINFNIIYNSNNIKQNHNKTRQTIRDCGVKLIHTCKENKT